MPSTTKKAIRCPQCGSRNDPSARRCATCTRPFHPDADAGEALYDELLWSQPISRGRRGRQRSLPATLATVAAVAVLGGLAANYLWLGHGPTWMHRAMAGPKDATWKTQTADPSYRVTMPGTPMRADLIGPTGPLQSAVVWVDASGAAVRDADTRAAGDLQHADEAMHAMLVVAHGPAPADANAAAPGLVAAVAPGATLTETSVVPDNGDYERYRVTAKYTNWPGPGRSGRVSASVSVAAGQVFVVASFSAGGEDRELSMLLDRSFLPVLPQG